MEREHLNIPQDDLLESRSATGAIIGGISGGIAAGVAQPLTQALVDKFTRPKDPPSTEKK
jgi:hypothetical protein